MRLTPKERLERLADALDDIQLSDDEAKDVVRELGIDIGKCAASIRAMVKAERKERPQ